LSNHKIKERKLFLRHSVVQHFYQNNRSHERRGISRGGLMTTPPQLRSSAVFHISLHVMHFRILKMIATSGFLTALECTKFVTRPPSIPAYAPAWT